MDTFHTRFLEGNLQLLGQALRAPISGRQCVAWELTVFRRVGKSRVCIHSHRAVARYSLSDGDVCARSDSPLQTLLNETEKGETVSSSEALEQYLQSHGFSEKDSDTTSNVFEWSEGIISEADLVVIYGELEQDGEDLLIIAPEGSSVVLAHVEGRAESC